MNVLSRIFARFDADHLRHAVKTGVAAVACLYVTDFFRLPQGYWAAISAMIALQSHFGATVSASLNRLAGTAIGAIVGGLFVQLWGRAMSETLRRLEMLYGAVVRRYRTGAAVSLGEVKKRFTEAFRRHDDLLKHAAYEPGAGALLNESLIAGMGRLTMIHQSIEAMELATRDGGRDRYPENFEPELERLLGEILAAFGRLSATIGAPHAVLESTELERAVSALDDKVAAVRAARISVTTAWRKCPASTRSSSP